VFLFGAFFCVSVVLWPSACLVVVQLGLIPICRPCDMVSLLYWVLSFVAVSMIALFVHVFVCTIDTYFYYQKFKDLGCRADFWFVRFVDFS